MATKQFSQIINPGGGYKLILNVYESEIDALKNTSKVRVIGSISRTGDTYHAQSSSSTSAVDINGTKYYPTTAYNLYANYGVDIFDYTQTIQHEEDGSKTIPIYWSFSGNRPSYNPNGSISVSCALTKIVRGAKISSVADFTDEENPTIKYSNPAGATATSLQACISFDGSTDNIEYRDIPKTGNSYTFQLTENERWALRQYSQTSQSVELKFFVQTVIGTGENAVTYRDWKAATMKIVNGDPTFEVEYLDTNATTTAITEDNQVIVQNQSALQIKVRLAEAYKEAYLVSAKCTVLGQDFTANFPDATFHDGRVTLDIGAVNSERDLDVEVVVTDSRGNTNSAHTQIQIASWKLPSAIITAQRHNNFYSETDVKVDADYSSVVGKNEIDIKVQTKQTGTTTWGAATSLEDNVVEVLTLDNNYAWDLKFTLTDLFGTTIINTQISRGMPLAFYDILKNSIGINCFPQNERSLEVADHIRAGGDGIFNNVDVDGNFHVGMNAYIDGELTVGGKSLGRNIMTGRLNANISSLTANTWNKITLVNSASVGSLLSISNGGIKIGAGVSKIQFSALVEFVVIATGTTYVRVGKNDSLNANALHQSALSTVAGAGYIMNIHPIVANVEEGDIIYFYFQSSGAVSNIYGNSSYARTSLTVEVLE